MSRIQQMLDSPLHEMRELGKIAQEEENLRKKLHIDELREIQRRFPEVIVTGSAALYLHGIRFERWKWDREITTGNNIYSDLDLIAPGWIDFDSQSFGSFSINFSAYGRKPDTLFDGIYMVKHKDKPDFKIDFYIAGNQRYDTINVEGYNFKVSCLEGIWDAKLKCGMSGVSKHLEDLQEAMNIQPKRNLDRLEYERKRREYSSGS